MARITPDIVAALKAHADVADIIGRFLPLKRAGNGRFLAVCPFHDDHSPSMNINSRMGIYKCFACGAAGDVIKFVQEHESLDFISAVEWIAHETSFTLPEATAESAEEGDARAVALRLHELAAEFFQNQLSNAGEAQRYLAERAMSEETIRTFRLGWAPREGFLAHALRAGFTRPQLVEFGLAVERDTGSASDRFRERLQFPIQNLTGKVLGFGGRTLQKGQPHIPKYLNSPDTLLYHKSEILYGLHHARQGMMASGEAIMVEGYFDIAQLYQAGIRNCAAVSGTAFTDQQAKLVARYAKKIYLVFDGDEAGRKAVRRSLDVLLPHPVEIRVLLLPQGEDPDSLVRAGGADAFLSRLPRSTDFLEFLSDRSATATPEDRARLYTEAGELIRRIGDPLLRKEYSDLASRRFGLSTSLLMQSPGRPQHQRRAPAAPVSDPAQENYQTPPNLEARLASLLFQHPPLFAPAHDLLDPPWLESSSLAEILDHALGLHEESGNVSIAVLHDRLAPTLQIYLARLPDEDWSPRTAELEFTECLLILAERRLERERQRLRGLQPTTDGEEEVRLRTRLSIQEIMRDIDRIKRSLRTGELPADGILRRYQSLRPRIHQVLEAGTGSKPHG